MEGTMNCPHKIREKEVEAAGLTTLEDKKALEELTILLEGRDVAEDYLS